MAAAVRALGWALLGLAAALGVALSAVVLLASSELGRPLVASRLVQLADDALAGSFSLERITVLPRGGIELAGARVFDPDGHLVLAIDRARLFADVRRLRNRSIGVTVELHGPSVLVEEEPGGGVSLARAFAPAHPSERAPGPDEPGAAGPGWAVRFERVTIRNGDVWWVDAHGESRLQARGLDLDGRALLAPGRSRLDLRVAGALDAPVEGPLSLEARAALDGPALRVPVLRARVGETALAALGEWNFETRVGRVAIPRLGVDPGELERLAPGAALGADLEAVGYAEADGRIATAAVTVTPRPGGRPAGRAHAAAAARLDGARAAGADLVLERFDPSRLFRPAPAGELTLSAHGGVAGTSLEALRGRASVKLARSRLRGGEVGPGELEARAARGGVEVTRLALTAPGLAVEGHARLARAGPVAGAATARAADLGAAGRNLSALLGARLAPLAGAGIAEVTLSGTAAAPSLAARVDAPRLGVGGVAAEGVHATLGATGDRAAPTATLDGTVDRLRSGREVVASALVVRGALASDGAARLDASAAVPGLGRDPVSVSARARRSADGASIALSELVLAYPGTRYALTRPATVALEGPRVLDRLELAAGPQRLALAGGLGPRPGALDARLEVTDLRLDGLPAGLLPAGLGLAGTLGADLRAGGTTRRPRLEGRFRVGGGAVRGLDGLAVQGEVRWDGAARRLAGAVALSRAAGGTADAALDLPVPLGRRPGEAVSARLRGQALPLDALLAAARVEDVPASGALSLEAELSGEAAAPALRVSARLAGGEYEDLGGVGLALEAALPGGDGGRGDDPRLEARLEATLAERPALRARAALDADPADLLARPGPALRALRGAELDGLVELPGLDLALLSGRLGLPDRLGGRLAGTVRVSGTPAAPRGQAVLDLADGAAAGYAGLAAHLEVDAAATGLSARARAALEGEEVLRVTARLGTPLERLGRAALRTAPLAVEATVPRVSLARTAALPVPVIGQLEGTLTAAGTLAAPRLALDLAGLGVAIEGRALGDPRVTGRWADGKGRLEATLAAASGGRLAATAAVDAPLGLDTTAEALLAAPAVVTLDAEALDLGFLPALLPGTVRAASGKLEAKIRAQGPLRRPSPRGTARLDGGRVAVTEYGDWSEIVLDAAVTDDAVELRRLAARRARGTLEARGALRGMTSGRATLDGRVEANELTITRAGMDFATLDLGVDAGGTWRPGALDVTFTVPKGTVRLPRRTPRELQTLERRPDILIGPPRERKARSARSGAVAGAKPLAVTARLVAPGRLFVVSDSPRIQIELKADVRYERQGAADYASGTVEVVRGTVEPIGGRNFEVQRGKVTFTGGPPKAALLDVEALYRNPAAAVTVTIAGPLSDPEIRLTSVPVMDEGQIALLIATGRTDLKAGSGGVSTGGDAGRAALGVVATQVFKNAIADKLPLDTVGLDSSSFQAGTYFTDKNIYVGYTRRFEAKPEKGENTDELRVEVPLSQRWNFEFRWGTANSGGGGLIWSRDY